MGYWGNGGMETSALANVNADGTVSLVVGTVDIGGLRATHAMQLAETLGLPYEDVHPKVVDTDSVGMTSVTGGSRSTFAGGWAMHEWAWICPPARSARAQVWEVARRVTYGETP